MRRLLSRGGLVWVAAGLLVYACGGDARRFVNGGGDDEGGDGSGGTNSGGTSGSGKGGTSGSGTSGDSGAAGDGGTTSTGGTGNRGGTAGTDGGMGGEAGEPEPPPPPGRPGTAVVAGGMWMGSTNYRLFVINGNGSLPVISSSTNYSLRGGIVGTTQP